MERDRGYTDADMAEVSDSSEWTAEDFARSESFAEAFPDLAAGLMDGVTVAVVGTTPVSIHLTDDIHAHYRDAAATGRRASTTTCAGRRGSRDGLFVHFLSDGFLHQHFQTTSRPIYTKIFKT